MKNRDFFHFLQLDLDLLHDLRDKTNLAVT